MFDPKAYYENTRDKRKAARLCVVCGKNPPAKDKTRCEKCIQIKSESEKKLYYDRKEKGLCVNCGEPAAQGVHCFKCALKAAAASHKCYEKKEKASGMIHEA